MITEYLNTLEASLRQLDQSKLATLVDLIDLSTQRGGKILLFGNGGSAANALHGATDFNMILERIGRSSYAIGLTANIADITRIANDDAFSKIFTNQLQQYLAPNDVVIALSTSGNSGNIVHALEFARSFDENISTVLLTIRKDCGAARFAELVICSEIADTQIAE